MQIIKLSPDRWREYKELRLEGLQESNNPWYFEALKTSDEEWKQRLVEAEIGNDRWMYFAEENNKLIGMLQGTLEGNWSVKIKAVFVKKEFRRMGIGKSMMNILIDELRKMNSIKKILLGVYIPNTPAVKLYESLGFEKEKEEIEILRDGSEQPRLAMALDL